MGMTPRTPDVQISELIVLRDIFYPKSKILPISHLIIYVNIYILYGYIFCKFVIILFPGLLRMLVYSFKQMNKNIT